VLIADLSVNPIALESIGYYYYIFYLGMLVFGVSNATVLPTEYSLMTQQTVLIYFTFPETKGRTLEELAQLFEQPTLVETFEVPVDVSDVERNGYVAKTPMEKIDAKV
jgi:hypothetical protein